MKIYLDNAATTQPAKEVIKEIDRIQNKIYGNASSLHSFGKEAKRELEKARTIIAKKINARPEEIIFTSGGSESDNLALQGYALANKNKGNHIITTIIEHQAILNTCKALSPQGFKIDYLSINNEGTINLKELEKKITKHTILISVMHANNEIGTVQNLKAIGKICKKHKIAFHTDAVQSFTKVPIDVKKMNLDLASLSAHKIHGPKGVGALYVKKGIKLNKLIYGGLQENNLRSGTENIAGITGFAKASTLNPKMKEITNLRNYMIQKILKEISNSHLNGSLKQRLCNNINIRFDFVEGESILFLLNENGIAVSTGSACSTHTLKPSYVLLALGLKHEQVHGSIRFTLSKYTTKKEIDYTIKHLKIIIKKLRRISPLTKWNTQKK